MASLHDVSFDCLQDLCGGLQQLTKGNAIWRVMLATQDRMLCRF